MRERGEIHEEVCVCLFVCVCERKGGNTQGGASVCVCVCVCVCECVREGERGEIHKEVCVCERATETDRVYCVVCFFNFFLLFTVIHVHSFQHSLWEFERSIRSKRDLL